MAKPQVNTAAANAYAKSVLDLANEQQQAEAVGEELGSIREAIESDPAVAEFLANPAVGEAERTQLLDRAFRGRVSPLVMNLIGVMNAKGRLGLLAAVAGAYEALLDEQRGKVEVDVTVAHRLDDGQLEEVRRRVGEALGRDAVVHQSVDESIIGGLILRVGDRLIDASVREQLQAVRRQMLARSPKSGRSLFGDTNGGDGNGAAKVY